MERDECAHIMSHESVVRAYLKSFSLEQDGALPDDCLYFVY